MSNNTSTAIKELKESPIFALSLGGKELSHSNFWAWLIEQKIDDKQPFIEVFMPKFYDNGYKFENVKREEGNRDISIHFKDKKGNPKCFVIENKLKSIPTERQLQDYKEKLDTNFAGGLLTGLQETLETLPEAWEFSDYDHIAKAIEAINEKHKNGSNYNFIKDYIEDIRNISKVIKNRIEEYKDIYIWEDKELDEVRLADIYLKHQAEIFKDEIKKVIADDSYKTKWGYPFIYTSFNHKKPTITVIYQEIDDKKKNDKDPFEGEIGRIGIQIEGNQFRIYGGPGKAGNKDFKFEDLVVKHKWFEEFDSAKGKTIDGNKTSMKGGREDKRFCQYKTRDYRHMYQYWDIDEETKYEKLIKEILKKLTAAKEIIDDEGLSFK